MFRERKKFGGCLAVAFVIFMLCSGRVNAQGTSTIRVSDSSPAAGQSVSVEVIASESGSVSVKYNPEVLTFTGCSQSYTTEGNTIYFEGTGATLNFTAAKEGKSSVIVSGTNVEGSSTSIQVSSGNASSGDDTSAQQSGDNEGQFSVDGVAYVVSERFSDDEIPAGFEKTREQIDGYNYKVLTDGNRTLVYLKQASDTSSKGTFYVYDKQSHSVSSFEAVQGDGGYVLVQKPDTVIGNAKETQIEVNGQQITAYSIGENSEFVLLYGVDKQGETGWFQYDTKEGTIQRMNESLLLSQTQEISDTKDTSDSRQQATDYQKKWNRLRYVTALLIFVVVILLVFSIHLFLTKKRWAEDMDDYDYEEEDTEEAQEEFREEEVFAPGDEEEEKNSSGENQVSYENIKGTEAFRSAKETRHKSGEDDHVDIIDLNDL